MIHFNSRSLFVTLACMIALFCAAASPAAADPAPPSSCEVESFAKAASGESRIGPFEVPPGRWVQTTILRNGQGYKVRTRNYLQYKDYPWTQIPPGGNYWSRFIMKSKLGLKLTNMYDDGGNTATQFGNLYLGAPSWEKMGEGEESALDPKYQFCSMVYVEDPVCPNRAGQHSLLVTMDGLDACPRNANVAKRARIRICNSYTFKLKLYSTSKSNIFNLPGYRPGVKGSFSKAIQEAAELPPGSCTAFTVRNPTKQAIVMTVRDSNVQRFLLRLVIRPT